MVVHERLHKASIRKTMKDWIGKKNADPLYRPFAVIMKSADVCNYDCSYCYVEHRSDVPIMSEETAKIAVLRVLEYVKPERKVNFIYHGGEPLIAGQEFFERVADLCDKFKDRVIENCIQTNGSLLDEKFLEFCKMRGFSVSLSIDGPKKIHDINRKDRNGLGTFDKTMASIELVKSAGLAPGCVCVLHKMNIEHIEEIYSFFRDNGIHFRLNPVVRAGRAKTIYNSLSISDVAYGKAMCRLFDLWFEDTASIQVEPLHTILGNFISPSVWGCDYHGDCLRSIISINPDGNVYPCGRFAGLEQFLLGNIVERESLESLLDTYVFRQLCNRNPNTVKGCSECEFVAICNTGCMITAHMARSNIHDRDYYCHGRKMIFTHIANRLKGHLEAVQTKV